MDDATISLPTLEPADAPPPEPPPEPTSAPASPSRWRRGAAVAALVVVAGAAGGVAGRVTAEDDPTPLATAAGTGSIAKLGDIQQVLARISPAVVSIRTQAYQSGRVFPRGGAGSGWIITADGEVLTNAHVVDGATSIKVTLNGEREARDADLLGVDGELDLALVKIRDASDLPTATLGSSADLRVGDSVVAIGNALDLGATPSVTEGIVSALNRSIRAPGESLTGLIQTDAAINPGNSGGPLVDAQGRVVGMNTAVAGDAQNIGFAIPIDAIEARIGELRRGSNVDRSAFLGVALGDADGGAVVQQVVDGSPADDAGLRAGDVIVSIDGDAVSSAADVVERVRGHEPGDEVAVVYERDGDRRTAEVTLGSRTASAG
jgi:putative serine protease PepD